MVDVSRRGDGVVHWQGDGLRGDDVSMPTGRTRHEGDSGPFVGARWDLPSSPQLIQLHIH